MIVVSDTSPILNLFIINRSDLLWQLFSEVIVSPSVISELIKDGSQRDPRQKCGWIVCKSVTDRVRVKMLYGELDEGEAESIVLASELGADLLLMDERRGRKVASRLNIPVIGIVGILIECKQRGIIQTVHPLLNELKIKAGFWLKDELIRQVLESVNEEP